MRYFPDVFVAEILVPRRHSGVANSVSNYVVVVPVGIVRGMHHQLGYGRAKGASESCGLFIKTSVATGAIHRIDLHSVDKVLIGGCDRTGYTCGAAIRGR